ncbi:MAG: type II toxin-antitoxin system RelE/ParE family toxin [Bacteroidota bacterium]
MSFASVISVKAQKELNTSWEWYEERQKGLGDRFADEVFKNIFLIEKNPERFPVRIKNFREKPLWLFPFVIIYKIVYSNKSVRILSVFHTSRNPKKK